MQAAAKAAAEAGSDDEPMGLASLAGGTGGEESMPDVPSVEAVRQQVEERTDQYSRKRGRDEDGDAEAAEEQELDLSSVPMLQGAGDYADLSHPKTPAVLHGTCQDLLHIRHRRALQVAMRLRRQTDDLCICKYKIRGCTGWGSA